MIGGVEILVIIVIFLLLLFLVAGMVGLAIYLSRRGDSEKTLEQRVAALEDALRKIQENRNSQ